MRCRRNVRFSERAHSTCSLHSFTCGRHDEGRSVCERVGPGQTNYTDAKNANRNVGISGGRSLTRPFRDARWFSSTGL
jgi:hypothetical protein